MKLRSTEVRRARPGLGTFVEIAVRGLAGEEAHRAIDAAFAAVATVQRLMSFHDPESMLSRLNREAARGPVQVDAWTFAVLRAAKALYEQSAGAFDVTIAPHLQELGFLPGKRSSSHEATPATFANVLLLPARRVRFTRADASIDLGGIAKGYAVDRAIAALRRAGAKSGLVNAGGDVRTFGEAQPVAVRHPAEPQSTQFVLPLRNAALATSANYFAECWKAGEILAPIIDPQTHERTGRVLSATVRARTAMLADALTKVVMLRGEESLPVLNHLRADAVFVSSAGEQQSTPRWHAALQFPS